MLDRVKHLLAHPAAYIAFQSAIACDRVRDLCIERLAPRPGECMVDVGCGPAQYFHRLPQGVRYFGFDTDERYIKYARRRHGSRGEFRCETFGQAHIEQLPPVDAVLMLGLLHHLSDDECRSLLALLARILTSGGRVITQDPTFTPGQGRFSRWMSANDRGGYVRTPEAFIALASESFGEVAGEVVEGMTRIPATYWVMRITAPVKVLSS